MRELLSIILVVAATGACKKGEDAAPATGSAGSAGPATAPGIDPALAVGVEAGGIDPAPDEGPAAVITAATGTVELRRVGEIAFFAVPADTRLYPGDVVRTGETSTATLLVSDESTIELAEVTTLGIATREGSADPASAAAVLAGLARFSVSPRTPGEGAFRVYTPNGVILTRGTVYGVGVSASGGARVGVESGAVDAIGLSALGGTPVRVEAGTAATFTTEGSVVAPTAWPADDWGAWRDEADARAEVPAVFGLHAQAMNSLETNLLETYAELAAVATQVSTFEALAAVSADRGDAVSYSASVDDGGSMIEASFALGGRIEALTWADAAHAELATDLYVRHPDTLAAAWKTAVPHVDAAILWPKRFEVTAAGYLEPVRIQYYVHHPRGREHAPLVGVQVPKFYAGIKLAALDPVRVRSRIKSPVWIAPEIEYRAANRPVWIAAPALDWREKATARTAAPRGEGGWYAPAAAPRAKIYVGANVRGKYESGLAIKGTQSRASLRGGWKVPVGAKVKVDAPDMQAAATARAKVKLRPEPKVVAVKVGGVGGKVQVDTAGIKADVKTNAKTTARTAKDAAVVTGKTAKDAAIVTGKTAKDAAIETGKTAKDAAVETGKSIKEKIKIKLGR